MPARESFGGMREMSEKEEMVEVGSGKWMCPICKYVYDPAVGDPDHGVPAGTAFEDLPDGWVCPLCAWMKKKFVPVEE